MTDHGPEDHADDRPQGQSGDHPDRLGDADLEQRFRAGLQRRAQGVDVPPDLLARLDTSSRRRRRVAALSVLGAAAAVAVAVVVVQVLPGGGDRSTPSADGSTSPSAAPSATSTGISTGPNADSSADPSADVSASDPGQAPSGSRYESWHGLQVTVPSDWGWGVAVAGCAVGARVDAAGEVVNGTAATTTPYVGRPILDTDVCNGGRSKPQAPYVWLGADVKPGTVDVGNGYTQETVDAGGTTLTVATTDAALRQRIIDSATTPACPTSITEADLPQAHVFGSGSMGAPVWAQLCEFHADGAGSVLDLAYGDRLDAQAASAYLSALSATPAAGAADSSCRTGDLAVVRFAREDLETQQLTVHQVVIDYGCDRVELTPTDARALDVRTALSSAGLGGLSTVAGSALRGPLG